MIWKRTSCSTVQSLGSSLLDVCRYDLADLATIIFVLAQIEMEIFANQTFLSEAHALENDMIPYMPIRMSLYSRTD